MRHQILGLHSRHQDSETSFDGVFLVRVERTWYRRHPQKPFVELRFVILDPQSFQDRSFFSQVYCTERALWKLHWFLRDFAYDADLLNRDQVDQKALLNLRGVVRTSHKIVNGRSFQNLNSFAPADEEQRQEFGRLVETTVHQIEAGHFNSHSGIRFPQNGCISCSHLGLCLNNQQLVIAKLIRKPGASDLDWLDELVD